MKIDELDYNLPDELIAQEPLARRDEARLLDAQSARAAKVEHSRFYKLARYLNEGDLLILNDTRVGCPRGCLPTRSRVAASRFFSFAR